MFQVVKRSLFRVAKISKTVKRGSFSDYTAKRVVFTEAWSTLFMVLSSILCSSTLSMSWRLSESLIALRYGLKIPS